MTTEIAAPAICPECDGPIVEFTEPQSGIITHWCENTECPGRIGDMLTFIADRKLLEIEGLGPELAMFLAKGGYVVTLADLFEFSNDLQTKINATGPEAVAIRLRQKGFPGAACIKMVETLGRAKTASWDRWLAALGIPMIGLSMGKVLATSLNLGPEDLPQLQERFKIACSMTIENLGPHKKEQLGKHSTDAYFADVVARLHNAGVHPTPLTQAVEGAEGVDAPLKGIVFCITGEFYEVGSREHITKNMVALGATAKTGVSKKLTHLLVGTEPGSSKMRKAGELNLPQLDEDWLTKTFKENGISVSGTLDWA